MPIGTMKAIEAIWMAMAWAASEAASIRPIRNAAALKIVTSKVSRPAIGRPSRNRLLKRGQSARQKRPNRR